MTFRSKLPYHYNLLGSVQRKNQQVREKCFVKKVTNYVEVKVKKIFLSLSYLAKMEIFNDLTQN